MKLKGFNRRESGMVLLISLLALVLLSIGAVVLVRSVDNATVLAGNMSFKQATVSVADIGVEKAIEFMKSPGGPIATQGFDKGWSEISTACDWTTAKNCQYYPKELTTDYYSVAKPQTSPSPSMCDPALNKGMPLGVPVCAMWFGNGTQALDWENIKSYSRTDDSRIPDGYSIRFVIDRLCNPLSSENSAWDPKLAPTDFTQTPPVSQSMVETYCRLSATVSRMLGSNAADHFRFSVTAKPTIFRVTVQVMGPRRTQSYVQALTGQ